MTTEPPTPSSEPGPTRRSRTSRPISNTLAKRLGAAIGASSANTDVTGRTKQKVAEAKDRIPERTIPTTDVLVENGPYRAIHRARQPHLPRGLGQTHCALRR